MQINNDPNSIDAISNSIYNTILQIDKAIKDEDEMLKDIKTKFPLPDVIHSNEDEKKDTQNNLDIYLAIADVRRDTKKVKNDLIAKKIECIKAHIALQKIYAHLHVGDEDTNMLDDDAKSTIHDNIFREMEKQKNG